MDDYIIEIDSSQRDANIYLDPNDYTLNLNKHVYNVERISLITGKIPTTQPLINRGNKQFQVDNQVIVLPEKNYSNGYVLASDLQTSLTSTNVSTVTYMSNTFTAVQMDFHQVQNTVHHLMYWGFQELIHRLLQLSRVDI